MKKKMCLILAFLIILSCAGCGGRIHSVEMVEGSRIGYLSGTSSGKYANGHGIAKSYASAEELVSALKGGSIDCIVADSENVKSIKKGHPLLKVLDEALAESNFRMAASRENPSLVEEVNRALAALKEDGTLDAIITGHTTDPDYSFECEEIQDTERKISVLVDSEFVPYCYIDADGRLSGIDVDIVRAVCAWLGIGYTMSTASGSELIPAVKNGSYQLALGGITAASEMADYCLMTEPYAVCTQIVIVR